MNDPEVTARLEHITGVTRRQEVDHTGAVQGLNAAMAIERDAGRRASLANLIRLLDTPR